VEAGLTEIVGVGVTSDETGDEAFVEEGFGGADSTVGDVGMIDSADGCGGGAVCAGAVGDRVTVTG
jgi:hypothetical protein